MKQGWEIKKLGEVCTIVNGRNQKEVLDENGVYPIYGSGGTTMGYASQFLCPAYSTIIGRKGSINSPIFKDHPFWNVDTAFGLCAKENFNCKLLHYFCVHFDFSKLNKGTTIPSLVKSDLLQIPIPVPSLLEQGRIVGVLDAAFAKIDALKENAQKNLENAKALFQQVLKQELTPKPNWQTKKLSEVCETITDFVAAGSFAALRENVKYNSEKDFAQLVRTTDIKSNFTKGKFVYVSKSAFDFLYRVNLDKQSIVLPNVGVNCGEVYIVNPSQLPYEHNVLGPNAILVRSDTESNEFLSYAFKGQEFQKSLLGIINSMAQPKFNKTSLKKLLVCMPDKAEQNLIVKKLHSVEQMCSQIEANAEKTIAECDALKQAVLRRAFNGGL